MSIAFKRLNQEICSLIKKNPYKNFTVYNFNSSKPELPSELVHSLTNPAIVNVLKKLNSQRIGKYPLAEINLPTLKIEEVVTPKKIAFGYEPRDNKIFYTAGHGERYFSCAMLYAMSSYYDSDRDIQFSGFLQLTKQGMIGRTLNLSYTELLNNRYFGEKPHMESLIPMLEILEDVIGRQKMEDIYFEADLNAFINQLWEYNVRLKEAMNFIKDIDIFEYTRKGIVDKFNHGSEITEKDSQQLIDSIFPLFKKLFDIYFAKYEIEDNQRMEMFREKLINSVYNALVDDRYSAESKSKGHDVSVLYVDGVIALLQKKKAKSATKKKRRLY